MNNEDLLCRDERRRRAVMASPDLNGIDYVEVLDIVDPVDERQRRLVVYFLNKLDGITITPAHVRISGGRRIRDIQTTAVDVCAERLRRREDVDDCMVVTVDKPGDFSTYKLCLVELDADGHPTDQPLGGFDPRYHCIDFSFKAGCPSNLDCKQEQICPPEARATPELNYLAKDYAGFRRLILDRLALIMPDWQERHVPDLGITLVELLAYAGDYLSYYQDAVATEAYLTTAHRRISVRRHARLVDYLMHEGCNARAWVCIETSSANLKIDPNDIYFVAGDDLPTATVLMSADLRGVPESRYQVFAPLLEPAGAADGTRSFYQAHNTIHFYTWGDAECCLPRGTTSATLRDQWVAPPAPAPAPQQQTRRRKQTSAQPAEPASAPGGWKRALANLQPGDILIFEEVLGPRTGNPADADPAHRHAVRLTRVTYDIDPLYYVDVGNADDQTLSVDGLPASAIRVVENGKSGTQRQLPTPVVEIEWAAEDALPFPLCLSAIGPPPACALIEHVSVARGNVVLVDHGRRVEGEALGTVPPGTPTAACVAEGMPAEAALAPGRFAPVLQYGPLTHAQPLHSAAPASAMLTQDPRQALPVLEVISTPVLFAYVATDTTPELQATSLFTLEELEQPERVPARVREPHNAADYALRDRLNARPQGAAAARASAPQGRQLADLLEHWIPVRDLLNSGADDRHLVAEIDERGRAHLRFGDGELGRRPDAGAIFQAGYRVGIGPAGNVGAETITKMVFRTQAQDAITRVRNPLPAQGGIAPESLAEVKLRAPYAFRDDLRRAITADDYARVVEREPGFTQRVQGAAGALRWNGSWYEALVTIDPLGRTEAGAALLREVEADLSPFRRIGHDLAVRGAQYVPLEVELLVCVKPAYLRGHVEAALRERLGNRLLADGTLGFFHPDNLRFGAGVRLSALVAAAQAVPGVESVVVRRLNRRFEAPNDEIKNGIMPLGPRQIARLDNDPSLPENGVLMLDVRGGR